MRLSTYVPATAAMLIAASVSLFAAQFSARAIESISAKAVAEKLTIEGYGWANVEADGLQIVLTGTAPDETAQLSAQRAAGHAVDPARVINVMDVAAQDAIQAPSFSIEILRNDHGISLIGLVPADWDKDAFIANLKESAATGSVADLLETADFPVPDDWADAVEYGFTAITLLPRAKISLSPSRIAVKGLADTEQQRRRFESRLDAAKPEGMMILTDIAAPRPVITPFTLRFLIDDAGARFDACSAETEQGRIRIIAAARAMGVNDPACVLGLGAPTDQWAPAVETAMRAVGELGAGAVTFSDNEVSLVGVAGTSASLFDKVAGELEAALPETFLLSTSLPEAEVETDEDTAQFIAIRSPEGQVQLRGRIGEERSQLAVEAFAKSAFGANSVYSALRQVEELPAGWAVRSLTAVEVLAKLDNGSVTMTDSSVRIRGRTGDAQAKANIARLLADKLGGGQNFDIKVDYVRKLDPVLALPTAQECVDRANQVLAGSKIAFAPGSTDVDDSALETLDRLARAFDKCEDMSIEVGAHSDSQGGEQMNLQLSQARAGSVVNALIGRRIVSIDFVAKGYGESEPIADNETEEGREANRRIAFKLTGDAAEAAAAQAQDAANAEPDAQTTTASEESSESSPETAADTTQEPAEAGAPEEQSENE